MRTFFPINRYPVEEMAGKIKAAVDARSSKDFLIIAVPMRSQWKDLSLRWNALSDTSRPVRM